VKKAVVKIIKSFIILMGFFLLLNENPKSINAEITDFKESGQNGYLVKYHAPSQESFRSLSVAGNMKGVENVEVIAPQVELITLAEGADLELFKVRLENDPNVEFVEPNYERHLMGTVNDPGYAMQWWVPHVKAESMWIHATTQKRKIVVGVIDTGIDRNHEDLKSRIEPGGYNFYANDSILNDIHGHGTMVSGVIAAESGNGKGITGVAGPYDVSILPLKVSDTGSLTLSNLIKAIDYAVDKKVDVLNLSLGGSKYSVLENKAIQRAIRADIVVVAAAGNEALKGNNLSYPASYDHVISVGAIDENNERSSFSNYNHLIDLVAPGERIYTTTPNDSYVAVHGTSFSAPIVAGTVAMMKGLDPNLSIDEIDSLLKTTAKDHGVPGPDPFYGAGVLDIERLIEQLGSLKDPVGGFIGDFPEITVSGSKVFTVTFNQELIYGKDYSKDILIARQVDGEAPVTSFTAKVDPANPLQLLIAPTTKWESGEHYLTITSGLQNNNGKALSKAVWMKFDVDDQFRVQGMGK